jgi:glycosyltransferase involved in cell wall biosynthesis
VLGFNKNINMPIVSIVIATRNRPQKLERLLKCIQQQDLTDFECIVVDDASPAGVQAEYASVWDGLDARFVLHRREHPGGPAQGRNTGIRAATGKYIAFCDDDDYWTRTDHLAVAVGALESEQADFFFANMQTSMDGSIANPDWFSALTNIIEQPIAAGSDIYTVERGQLAEFLKHRIHHANTMVVAKDLLNRIDLYWEKVSFAEDHDLSFRLSDAAQRVLFRRNVTADLDVSFHPSIARTYSEQERLLFGTLAALHAEANISSALLRKVARGNRAWRLIELAQYCQKNGQSAAAVEFVWQSLLLAPSSTALRMLLGAIWQRMTPGSARHQKQSS